MSVRGHGLWTHSGQEVWRECNLSHDVFSIRGHRCIRWAEAIDERGKAQDHGKAVVLFDERGMALIIIIMHSEPVTRRYNVVWGDVLLLRVEWRSKCG